MFDKKKYMEKWRKDNKKHKIKYDKQWKKNNPEYMKKWLKENPESNRPAIKRYFKTEKGKACNQRGHFKRQARFREIINTLTAEEWLNILKENNFRCIYCGKDLLNLFDKPVRDHIIPISKGGNNTKENVTSACRSCNAKKYNKIIVK
jgi:5-methylcytosine-specific restriction endonuclease McrA